MSKEDQERLHRLKERWFGDFGGMKRNLTVGTEDYYDICWAINQVEEHLKNKQDLKCLGRLLIAGMEPPE